MIASPPPIYGITWMHGMGAAGVVPEERVAGKDELDSAKWLFSHHHQFTTSKFNP